LFHMSNNLMSPPGKAMANAMLIWWPLDALVIDLIWIHSNFSGTYSKENIFFSLTKLT
jgi:hypothetical protein